MGLYKVHKNFVNHLL